MQKLRNIAIIAHVDHGKTTLVDKMIVAGHLLRGDNNTGDLIMDNNDLERERGITILAKNTSVYYQDIKMNIIDTPGYFDFAGEMLEGVSVVDSAVIVVSSTMSVGTEKAWEFANSRNIPRVIFVNKMHDENADFDKIYAELKEMLGNNECGTIENSIVTWKSVSQERLDSKKLKTEHPELYKKYAAKTTYRRFSIQSISTEKE